MWGERKRRTVRHYKKAANKVLKFIFRLVFAEVTGPDYYTMDEHLSRVGQDLDINQLMLLLTESDFNGYHDNNAAEQQN